MQRNTKSTAGMHGVVVGTTLTAGGLLPQHAEGVVVTTTVKAGGRVPQHTEALFRR